MPSVSGLVQQDELKVVVDMEPFFKTGPPPEDTRHSQRRHSSQHHGAVRDCTGSQGIARQCWYSHRLSAEHPRCPDHGTGRSETRSQLCCHEARDSETERRYDHPSLCPLWRCRTLSGNVALQKPKGVFWCELLHSRYVNLFYMQNFAKISNGFTFQL